MLYYGDNLSAHQYYLSTDRSMYVDYHAEEFNTTVDAFTLSDYQMQQMSAKTVLLRVSIP